MSPSLPETVRAVVASADLSKPTVVDLPFGSREDVQHPAPHGIVVVNHAAALNPTDYKIRTNTEHAHGDWSPKAPVVLGSDGAGVAVKIGRDVKHVKVGDRVAGMLYGASSEVQGTASEGYVLDAALAWAVPPEMSDAEAASISLPHFTAVQTLYMRWNLARPSAPVKGANSKTILVWGGSTAVGHHAVQLLALSGYKVFVTASESNHAYLRTLGADQCFDYKHSDVLDKIKAAAGSEGIYAAYDPAATGDSTLKCIDAIGSTGGRVMSTLPPSDEAVSRRADVKVEFVLVYTLVGYAFRFASAFDFPAMPEDRDASYEWVTKELPLLLNGWKEGQGSQKYKAQRLRISQGLDRVHEGLQVLGQGSYRAEKLVYTL